MPAHAFTALIVPVPAADWLVAGRPMTAGHAAGLRVPAHLTLTVPFAPPDQLTDGMLGELEALFADVLPFGFELAEVSQFPDGPVYLAPDPAAPFRQLMLELARSFPEYPPYEGRFDGVVPHVTVPLLADETLGDVQRLVAEHGPMQPVAAEVHLVRGSSDGIELVAQFPFGTAAA